MVIFHSYVSLPEGITWSVGLMDAYPTVYRVKLTDNFCQNLYVFDDFFSKESIDITTAQNLWWEKIITKLGV